MLSQHPVIFFHSIFDYVFIRGTVLLVFIMSARDSFIIVVMLSGIIT